MKQYKIFDKDFYFDYNVYAQKEIAKLCPSGTLNNLGRLIDSKQGEGIIYENLTQILIILNKAASLTRRFFEGKDDSAELTEDMIYCLRDADFSDLTTLAFACISEGNETEVETKSTSKKEESNHK